MLETKTKKVKSGALGLDRDAILRDYRIALESRHMSLTGRREVMAGKAKFGIFGDGKEVPQLALAHAFQPGDFRSGYYRDQTLMLALEIHTLEELFAQLYAIADSDREPASGGRAMNAHFATRSINPDGSWNNLAGMMNTSADISPTAGQMPRLVGLGYASRLYRELAELKTMSNFSNNGNEVAFGTIGNASCAEGPFWESINAIGVLGAPVVMSIWDDEYGISVHNEHQITKQNLSELLSGFQRKPNTRSGFDIYRVKAWDYPALVKTFRQAAEIARTEHVPAIVHVVEVTQPQGHSTSGSHERYKSAERLNWEREHDCNLRMRQWILDAGIADEPALIKLEEQALQQVDEIRRKVWEDYKRPIERERDEAAKHLRALAAVSPKGGELEDLASRLLKQQTPYRRDIMVAVRMALVSTLGESSEARNALARWRETQDAQVRRRYESHLYSESPRSALKVPVVPAEVGPESPRQTGFEILNACFEAALNRDPRVVAFGEDVGQLGDVNQGFKGLQEKFGPLRVSDTGIRECTIMGQAIGLALRGLRPIAEIQYLDYLLYGLQILSDDLSTLHWRTVGGQKAPVIVRTRGHRLEGIWHSGSPMAGIINNLRGMYVMVPRNMTQAAGFYNTMLQSDDPGLIVEVLNAYRQRERMPANVGTFTVPLGVPEILHPGRDLTLVTYGAMCPIALQAVQELEKIGISVELIDVQTLLPFDIHGAIVESLKKTSRVIFIDEDLPGGATAYMMQEVLEKQGGYRYLDSPPRTLTAGAHRPAYGSDGDYWSKPNTEEIMRICNRMMHEVAPDRYPRIF